MIKLRDLFSNKRLVLTVCVALFLTLSGNAQNNEYVEELRGVWITNVDSDVLFTKESIAEAMDYLADRGFNVIYPVVWNKGFTLHPSDVAENAFGKRQDTFFEGQGRDPLAEIIVEAHRRGLEVIPWFEYGFASVFGDPTGGHIIQANPHWAARDVDSNLVVQNNFYWMNAIHPEVQQFMIDLIQEVIDNYDIDGIQGDDRLPAMSSKGGYSDYTKQLYRDEHDGAEPPAQFDQVDFLQWKADKLTNFAGRLYRQVKETDSTLIVSFSPSIYNFSLVNYLQDWPNWIDSGYVDIVHPQAYRYDIGGYKQIIRNMFGQQPISSAGYLFRESRPLVFPGVLIKAGSTFNDDDYVLEAIDFNRSYDLKGEVYFFYEGLDEKNNNLADTLFKYKYGFPALPPHRNGKIRRPEALMTNETDAEVVVSGDWTLEGTPAGFVGQSLVANAGTNSKLEYYFTIPNDAWYRVYTWIPDGGGNATNSANYKVFGKSDTTETVINQQPATSRGWIEIGNVFLEKGTKAVVEVDAALVTDNKPTYADAVMLILDRKKSPEVGINAIIVSNAEEPAIPEGFSLDQNYPNPFNPTTEIKFSIPKAAKVSLDIFDVLGRKVTSLLTDKRLTQGQHQVSFNANGLASGMYIYRLSAGEVTISKKMILIK